MPGAKFLVSGSVQGVGFRAYVKRMAVRLGIAGRVWNRDDGAVELIAHASDGSRLVAMEQALWAGPGSVEMVVSCPDEDAWIEGFRIVSHDRSC
jgi:acylphosphatase